MDSDAPSFEIHKRKLGSKVVRLPYYVGSNGCPTDESEILISAAGIIWDFLTGDESHITLAEIAHDVAEVIDGPIKSGLLIEDYSAGALRIDPQKCVVKEWGRPLREIPTEMLSEMLAAWVRLESE